MPKILHHSDPLGVLGLEDLGDVTLQAHLGAATASEHAALYRQAVGLIARMQQRGEALRSDAYPPYRIAFDVEKLTWELEFFVKHYLLGLQGRDARRRPNARRCAPSGPRSSRSWPTRSGCSAIAIITAAT